MLVFSLSSSLLEESSMSGMESTDAITALSPDLSTRRWATLTPSGGGGPAGPGGFDSCCFPNLVVVRHVTSRERVAFLENITSYNVPPMMPPRTVPNQYIWNYIFVWSVMSYD